MGRIDISLFFFLNRKSLLIKINYVEKQAIADLQTKIINLAVNYTEEILIKNSNSSSQENIINNSIDEIKKSLDSKDNFI